MPTTTIDLALFCLALAVLGGWIVWVAIPWLAEAIRGNWVVSVIVWPLIAAALWDIFRPLIHALTA